MMQYVKMAAVAAAVVFVLAWADGKWGILPQGDKTGKPMGG